MPTWTKTVPDDPRGHGFPILRTPSYKPLVATATSLDLIGTYTHFWKGRTLPCEGDGCEPCREGVPFRFHAYFAAFDSLKSLHFIFEVTAQAAEAFTAYRDTYHTIRGCQFEARRQTPKPNGRVLIRTRPADLTKLVLPEPPDVIKCLSVLWDLPTS